MNLSGEAVKSISRELKIIDENIIVLHDDMNIPSGTIRLRNSGTCGGQNGIRNILYHLSDNSPFIRIRYGIGRPSIDNDTDDTILQQDQVSYVLGTFKNEEIKQIERFFYPLFPKLPTIFSTICIDPFIQQYVTRILFEQLLIDTIIYNPIRAAARLRIYLRYHSIHNDNFIYKTTASPTTPIDTISATSNGITDARTN